MVIKKSLRKGGRYILFKQYYENKPLTESDIVINVRKTVGLIDMPPLKIIHLDESYGLLKTNNFGLQKVILSLIVYKEENRRIEVLDSSGTIKSIIERNPYLKGKIKKN